jgi:hypothetical protein
MVIQILLNEKILTYQQVILNIFMYIKKIKKKVEIKGYY